jgi:hypothetical protein
MNVVDFCSAVVENILPLAEAWRGHEISQSGHARGKISLRVLEA